MGSVWTLYHGTFAHDLPHFAHGVQLGVVQGSDFSANDRQRPFYSTRDVDCARLWARQKNTWNLAFGIAPVRMAIIEFRLNTTNLQTFNFGANVTTNWQNFTWRNYQANSTTDATYQHYDVIEGPMTANPGEAAAQNMSIWTWPNGSQMHQVAVMTAQGLANLAQHNVIEFDP